jgi:hypothetical protein
MPLDRETADALDYARADMNSPADHVDDGARVFTSRERARVARRYTIPVHACPGATEIIQRLGANTPPGDVVEDSCEENRRDVETLVRNSFPVGDVPWEVRRPPTMATRHAAAFLVEHLAGVADGQLADDDVASRVSDAFAALLGFHPDQLWILDFLTELRGAALERLNWATRLAELDESRRAAFSEPPELLAHADLVVERTRAAAAACRIPSELPQWLDAQLVAYLIPRFGFAHGKGGASRVISEETLARMLASPRLMLKDLLRAPHGAARWESHINRLRLDPRF